MTTSYMIVPERTGLEEAVKSSLKEFGQMKLAAQRGFSVSVPVTTVALQPSRVAPQRKVIPWTAVKIGQLAERAWALLTPKEKTDGLPLWKLAALASFKFVPEPARKLERFQGHILVHRLVRPGDDLGRAVGFAFLSRELPGYGRNFLGVKMFDSQGRVLVALGEAPVASHETHSPFTKGIVEGSDRVPRDWIFKTKTESSLELTRFVLASIPRRLEL